MTAGSRSIPRSSLVAFLLYFSGANQVVLFSPGKGLSVDFEFSPVFSYAFDQQNKLIRRSDGSGFAEERASPVLVPPASSGTQKARALSKAPDQEEHRDSLLAASVRDRVRRADELPKDPGKPKEGKVRLFVDRGSSDGARLKVGGLRRFTSASERLAQLRQDAAKKCREGEKESCETPEKPLAKTLNFVMPELPEIKPFVLQGHEETHGRESSSSSPLVHGTLGQPQHRTTQQSSRKPDGSRQEHTFSSSYPTRESSPALSPLTVSNDSSSRSRKKGIDNRQLAILASMVDADEERVFVELQSKGFFDMLNNMFLGGNGANNPQNFEGGNQGSFFNFMYPHSTDYPWACVCDENSFKKYENKEIEAVPCRNEVDMSAQGVVAFCDPRNHKMNSARPGSSLSWSELFLVLFMPSLLIHLNLLHVSLL